MWELTLQNDFINTFCEIRVWECLQGEEEGGAHGPCPPRRCAPQPLPRLHCQIDGQTDWRAFYPLSGVVSWEFDHDPCPPHRSVRLSESVRHIRRWAWVMIGGRSELRPEPPAGYQTTPSSVDSIFSSSLLRSSLALSDTQVYEP